MPFVVLISTTGMNDGDMKLKKNKSIKHIVTISVAVTILIAFIIVIGIVLAFDLPPTNQKFIRKQVDLSHDKENWKREVHAVFAINLVGPKDMRLRRSIENVKRYTLQVIRSLLFNYYGSDAQFVIQSYSVPGKTTISDLCDAACTMRHIDQIDQQATFTSENPNQTHAVWQYYHYSIGRKPSLYVLFVADRASYRDDVVFEKDMEDSSKVLEETKLVNKTETVLIDDVDAAHYFMYSSIVTNGRSAFETANLINERLISYYRNDDELHTATTNAATIDSSDFIAPSTTEEISLISITDKEKTIPSNEFAQLTTIFHPNTDVLETRKQVTTVSSTSSTAKFNEITGNESSIKDIPQSTFDTTDSHNNPDQRIESRSEEDFIVERRNMFRIIKLLNANLTERDNDSNIQNDRHLVTTESTFILPFQWTGNDNGFGEMDDKNTINVLESINALTQLNPTLTDQMVISVANITDEAKGIRSNEHSEKESRLQYTTNAGPVIHESTINEMSDNSFSNSFSSETLSPAFETKATIDIRLISDTNSRINSSGKFSTILDAIPDSTETLSLLLSPPLLSSTSVSSLLLRGSSSDVVNDSIYTSTKNKEASVIDETTVSAEEMISTEMDKNAPGITNFSEKKTHLTDLEKSSTIPVLPRLGIDDSPEDLIPTSTSINLDNLASSRKNVNALFADMNNGFTKTKESNPSFAEINNGENAGMEENEPEYKESTVSELIENIFTSRNDHHVNQKIKSNLNRSSHILDLTELKGSTIMVDSRTSFSEAPQIISEDSSDARSSTLTINPDTVEAFIQEDILSSTTDKNTEQFTLEKSNLFFPTDLSEILTSSSSENAIHLSETLTGTSVSLNDEEPLVMTHEPLLTDNLQQRFDTSNGLFSSTGTSEIVQTMSSSQTANNLFEDSELSTIPTTMLSDEARLNFTSDTISGQSSDMPSVIESTEDGTIIKDDFAIEPLIFRNHEISDFSSQASESSNLSMENFIAFTEPSTVIPEITNEAVKEIETTTAADYETNIVTSIGIPTAVFNITVPYSSFDPKFSSHINRANRNYSYLLIDEVNYPEEGEDSSKITFNIDNETTFMDDFPNDVNETNNDLYSDHDNLPLPTDDAISEKEFSMENLATNAHEMNFQPETETTPIFNGFMQANTINNQGETIEDYHHSLSPEDGVFSPRTLRKDAISISTLENIQIPNISQDFEGFEIESDDMVSDNREDKISSIIASQITDPMKSFTTPPLDETFNTETSAVRDTNPTILNRIENQSNTLSLKHISTTPIPEIEEIANLNTNHKKIVYQTLTMLKVDESTNDDSSESVISTIPWASTSKSDEQNVLVLSSDKILTHELNATTRDSDSQFQSDTIIASSDINNESLSITKANNNIINTESSTDITSQSVGSS
ncbi:DNA-directed RNA polymerase subunit beta [Dirofilaria immitis]